MANTTPATTAYGLHRPARPVPGPWPTMCRKKRSRRSRPRSRYTTSRMCASTNLPLKLSTSDIRPGTCGPIHGTGVPYTAPDGTTRPTGEGFTITRVPPLTACTSPITPGAAGASALSTAQGFTMSESGSEADTEATTAPDIRLITTARPITLRADIVRPTIRRDTDPAGRTRPPIPARGR